MVARKRFANRSQSRSPGRIEFNPPSSHCLILNGRKDVAMAKKADRDLCALGPQAGCAFRKVADTELLLLVYSTSLR
jgi:hypothetical protein